MQILPELLYRIEVERKVQTVLQALCGRSHARAMADLLTSDTLGLLLKTSVANCPQYNFGIRDVALNVVQVVMEEGLDSSAVAYLHSKVGFVSPSLGAAWARCLSV